MAGFLLLRPGWESRASCRDTGLPWQAALHEPLQWLSSDMLHLVQGSSWGS